MSDVYEVERIVMKKIMTGGKIFYFIKWKDYPEAENTWEPIENLDCEGLIREFEAKEDKIVQDEQLLATKKPPRKRQSSIRSDSSTRSNSLMSSASRPQTTTTNGFEDGLVAETILGATDVNGELMFLIKWKDNNEASLIPAKIANVKCPQEVIQYLEKKITYVTDSN